MLSAWSLHITDQPSALDTGHSRIKTSIFIVTRVNCTKGRHTALQTMRSVPVRVGLLPEGFVL